MPTRMTLTLAWVVLLAAPAAAQNQPEGTRVTVRGTIEKFAGHDLSVKTREGPVVAISLADNFRVRGVAKRSLSDIKPGDYVASASVKGTDGLLHAVEVHIFPEALRKVVKAEQRPSDLVSGGLMTNATVTGITDAPHGHVLKVTYDGGSAEVVVGPDTPIVTYVPGDPSLLRQGAAVSVPARKMPDGTLTAATVTAEKDGVKPPM
ncbi:MAG TPA: hypothetical protein VJR70_01935 [Stellaceae bacterium]|nr:hypothetical protein [Stellaceae bacterium]